MKSQYPYYGKSRHNDVIVYFVNERTGFVVEEGDQSVIMQSQEIDEIPGQWCDCWNEFESFEKIEDQQLIKKLERKRMLIQLTQ